MLQYFTAVVFLVLVSTIPGVVRGEDYTSHKTTKKNGDLRYTFTGKLKPRLTVQQGTTCDILSVNKVLKELNLPTVSKRGTVQSLLTGQRSHLKKYVWVNPFFGALTVVSAQCENQSERYECIWQVIISS